jgi:predicted NBD/HSP70 family sugar kinase
MALRRANLGLLLRSLRDQGPRSRAALAHDLHMTRSTVSTLVAELADRGLVRDGEVNRSQVGRPSTTVELDGHVCGLGVEINVDHVRLLALDLAGAVRAEAHLGADPDPERVLDSLAAEVERTVATLAEQDTAVVGLTVGVAGLVDRANGVLRQGPNLGWRELPLGDMVRSRLGSAFPIEVENEGNLAAAAEAVPGDPDREDLLVIHAEVGVGGGIIAEGRLLRGRNGYAGEFGHMAVEPGGTRCGCGRVGCWETVVGLRALLERAADPGDHVRDSSAPLEDRLAELNRRADAGDARTLAALEHVGSWLGVGAALLGNSLNPSRIVLSGYYSVVGEHIRGLVEQQFNAGVLAPDGGGTQVELSRLGFTAAVRGGAMASLEAVFTDPTIVAPRTTPVTEVTA